MMHKIIAPVPGFNGQVAGVWFADSVAETDHPSALAYFRRQGYGVEPIGPAPDAPQAEQPAGRSRPRRKAGDG